MATIAADPAHRAVAVGRVFGRAFAAILHNPGPSLVLTILFAALPLSIVYYLMAQVPWQYMVVTIGNTVLPATFASGVARWFFSLLLGAIVQGALTLPVIAEAQGRRAGLGEALGAAGRVVLTLTIMGAILGVSVIIGTSLLIVPGLLVYMLWAIAPSIAADEREGVFLALSRSQELGEGARWKVFAIVLILLGMTLVALLVLGLIAGLLLLNGTVTGFAAQTAIRVAFGTIINVVWGAVLASLYVELKQWQEGDSVESLEQVFA